MRDEEAGLIAAEETPIPEQANGWVDSPGVHTDAREAGWAKVTAALHARGTPFFLQLWHPGRASRSSFHGGRAAVAAVVEDYRTDQYGGMA